MGSVPPEVSRPRCADAARERQDPLAGTAPPARRWLLLEHPGPWRVDAVAGSGVEPGVLSPLVAAAAAEGTRLLLVRRPGRVDRAAPRRWLLTGPGVPVVGGPWRDDADLLDARAAVLDPSRGTAADDLRDGPLLLVCAHGVHDTCCAVRGRPVAAALERRWPGRVLECSHVGGDRFAPNVVVLPDGFYYGGLDPATAVETIASHLAGAVDPGPLRGMARFPPVVQVAVLAVHVRHGPLGPDDVEVTAVRGAGAGRRAPDDGEQTVVELAVPRRAMRLRAELVTAHRPVARLTCRAARETAAAVHRVVDLSPLPG